MDSSDSDVPTSKKVLKCTHPGCNAVFSKNRKLNTHILKHTGERPFVCDESGCGKTYTNSSHLRRHKKVTHGEKATNETVVCDFEGCGMILANKYSLKKHYVRQHNPEHSPFKCTECPETFHKKKQLQEHKHVHTGEMGYSCDECDLRFSTKYLLNKHKIRHRTYTCPCGEEFNRWSLILAHKKVCEMCKKKRYSCEICNKTYAQLWNLKEHRMKHKTESEQLVFICPYQSCERKYFQKRNLQAHINNYHRKIRKENFKCTYPRCNSILKTKRCLKNHLEKHFQWRLKKERRPRHDKGKPKKAMVDVLVGESGETAESQTDKQSCIGYDDPLLEQCDLTLNLLKEQMTAA